MSHSFRGEVPSQVSDFITMGEVFAKLQDVQQQCLYDLKDGNNSFRLLLDSVWKFGMTMAESAKNEVLKDAKTALQTGIGLGIAAGITGLGSVACVGVSAKASSYASKASKGETAAANATKPGLLSRLKAMFRGDKPIDGSVEALHGEKGVAIEMKPRGAPAKAEEAVRDNGPGEATLTNAQRNDWKQLAKKWERYFTIAMSMTQSLATLGNVHGKVNESRIGGEKAEYTLNRVQSETRQKVADTSIHAVEGWLKTNSELTSGSGQAVAQGCQAIIASSQMRG
jgi:hypothetical protein